MNGVTVIAERVVPDYVGWLVLAVLFGAVALLPLGVVIWWLKGCFDTLMWGGPWACYRFAFGLNLCGLVRNFRKTVRR